MGCQPGVHLLEAIRLEIQRADQSFRCFGSKRMFGIVVSAGMGASEQDRFDFNGCSKFS